MSDAIGQYGFKACGPFLLLRLITVIDTIAPGVLHRTIFGVRPLA